MQGARQSSWHGWPLSVAQGQSVEAKVATVQPTLRPVALEHLTYDVDSAQYQI